MHSWVKLYRKWNIDCLYFVYLSKWRRHLTDEGKHNFGLCSTLGIFIMQNILCGSCRTYYAQNLIAISPNPT